MARMSLRNSVLAAALVVVFVGGVLAACPAGTPTTGPAAPKTPPPARLIPPLHDAQPGEWLTLVRGSGDGEWLTRMRVVAAGDTTVKIETLTYVGGQAQGAPVVSEFPRNGFGIPPGGVNREFLRERVEIDGEWMDTWRIRMHARNEVRYYWISEEIPVHGVLMIDRDRKGRPEGNPYRLKEYGFDEGK